MLAHRMKIVIPDNHEVLLRLPSALPSGEAEVIVLAEAAVLPRTADPINGWLSKLAADVPDSPVIPLEALRRENLYE